MWSYLSLQKMESFTEKEKEFAALLEDIDFEEEIVDWSEPTANNSVTPKTEVSSLIILPYFAM